MKFMFSRDREIISLAGPCGKEIERQEKMVPQKYIQNPFRPGLQTNLFARNNDFANFNASIHHSGAHCNQPLHLHERIPHERRNVNHQFVSVEKRTHPTLLHSRIALPMQLKAKLKSESSTNFSVNVAADSQSHLLFRQLLFIN